MAARLAWRSKHGGILWLRELIESYPAEIAADFRSRYNLSIFDAGYLYTYKEAVYLAIALHNDTTSLLFTKVNDWDYPISQETLATLELLDAFILVNSDSKKKKPKAYPRPYNNKKVLNRSNNIDDDDATIGKAISREKAIALLNKSNPQQ